MMRRSKEYLGFDCQQLGSQSSDACARDFGKPRVLDIGNDFGQPLDAVATNGRHDPKLGKERADRVDDRRLLSDEQIPGAMEHQAALLLRRVMGSSTSIVTERSPYIVRTFYTNAQVTVPMAQWAIKNGIKRAVTLVSDYAPGFEVEKAFVDEFRARGGEIVQTLRVPLQSTEFAPYLQRARDAKPDALFVWIPGGLAGPFLRQYVERGLHTSGIRLIGTGDITDDGVVNQMGDAMLGITTAFHYSAAHLSAVKAFLQGFKRVSGGLRPDHVGLAVYDGMHLIYEALNKTGGNTNGDALIAAMKGMSWESPRGPITIDPDTQDVIQDVYIRRIERVDGELYNVEFER